jgi:hypothetical protein
MQPLFNLPPRPSTNHHHRLAVPVQQELGLALAAPSFFSASYIPAIAQQLACGCLQEFPSL